MNRIIVFVIASALFVVNMTAQEEITLKKIWKSGLYSSQGVKGVNFYEGTKYTKLENNKINLYDIKSGEQTGTILDPFSSQKYGDIQIQNFKFTGDKGDLLLTSAKKSIYRYSYTANYNFYDSSKDEVFPIGKDNERVMVAGVSPNTEYASFVKDNNLYIQNLSSDKIIPVTTDGEKNKIINGSSDWVYEEEFAITKSYEWSPNSSYLAYIKYDESEVPEFTMNYYSGAEYPLESTFKYPKVGEKNSVVTMHIYNIETGQTKNVKLDAYYIPRIQWSPEGDLLVSTMNRHQNHLTIYSINPESMKSSVFLEEKNDAYINIHSRIKFLDNGDFFWISEKDGWNHVYLYNKQGGVKKHLTKGEYDVTSFYGYDSDNQKIYFQAAKNEPIYREIYSLSLKTGETDILQGGNYWRSAEFSEDFSAYILKTSTKNQPPRIAVYSTNGEMLRLLEDNATLAETQKEYGVNEVNFFKFKGPGKDSLYGWKIMPDNFDENKKYPVLMYQYSGPNSQQVTDKWMGRNYWWFQMLADRGYIIACIDGRGTGARGEKFRKMTYQKLGKYETEDQIAAANYLGDKSYVDESRIGIWGWSYGGFMATNAILKGNDIFSLAIAVAPVTNWKWYDTIYTERYMRTDDENPDGYANNSPVNFASELKGDYLLIHGMADDNVHFQHSVEMAEALIRADKQFDTYFYPNRNHGIYGLNARHHLYSKMTDFIMENL